MHPHKLLLLVPICLLLTSSPQLKAQKQKVPTGGRFAVVVDERLSALRTAPDLRAPLVRRIGRGRLLAVKGVKTNREGLVFFLVNSSTRSHGWIQREAIVIPSHPGSDVRLLSLIKLSTDFDRIARARIFLDYFSQSPSRAEVLLMLGDTAERLSAKLSQEATRRIGDTASAPEFSFFLNYAGLDRYNRQGVKFVFNEKTRRLHYDGSAWREITRRYPQSKQAQEARRRLAERSGAQ